MSPPTEEQCEQARQVLLEHAKADLDSMRTPGVADKMLSSASDFTRPGVEYVLRNAFDGIWSRDGLEKKYRSLVVISEPGGLGELAKVDWRGRLQSGLFADADAYSILASTGKTAQLKSHVGMGLSNGLNEVEIREAVLHVMGYCGFPTGLDAFSAAEEAIKAWKAAQAQGS
ncbi:hypothetical protein JCM24511_07419 [Saitozyma sp. JCM 24511]|nr:hypothetical protein JCM24511_07419 [Saitozyma sp. JCM 24511]